MEEIRDLKSQHPCGDLFRPTNSPIYNNTIFNRFFEVNDKAVMKWAENVLEKLEGNGILPTFLNKKDNPDFKAFWGTVTHMFALIVLYARKYKEIDSNRILFELFIQDRGLVTSLVDSQEQMEYLFYNYLEEYSKRGRLDIVSTEGELLGELLRLIRYNSVDEFIFALLRPENTGWSLGFSSPTWDRTDTVMNVSKGFEQSLGVESLNNYPLLVSENIGITQDENGSDEIFNAMTFFGNQLVGIDGRADRDKLIIVDPNMSYEISLQVKVSVAENENLKFGVVGYETVEGDALPMGIIESGQIQGSSIWFHTSEYLTIPNEGIYYNLKGLLLSTNEKFVDAPKLNFNTGRALSLMPTMKYIAPIFTQNRAGKNIPYVYIYDFKIKPLYLPFSQGYLGERDIIAAYYKNNSYQGESTVENYLKKYLIGYKNIFGGELIRPYIGEESYRILFKVFSNRNKYIPNATINVFGQTLKTDVNGEAIIVLPRGQYLYDVAAVNFEEVQNSISVTQDAVEYIQLQGAAYERVVTFTVKDKATAEPLSGVKLTFANKTKYTQASGILTFDVFPGIYQYVAELEDYYIVRRTVEIIDSTNIVIEMDAIPYYNVTFRIRNGVDPVSGASVLVTGTDIEDQTGASNAQGLATGFTFTAGTYHYKVVKEGYITTEDDFTIYGDAIIDVQFKPIPKYNVEFVVKNNALPVSKVNVTFNGATLQTDNNGRARFIEIAGSYNWKVSKAEFYAQEGIIQVIDRDVVKEIDLVQIGYTIDFTVVDEQNNPLENAQVSVGTEAITTSSTGTAQFIRTSGSYNWTVSKTGYYLQQGVAIVNAQNQAVKVILRLITYNVVFTVRIDNQPVANQPVVLGTGANEETLTTDGKGNVTFNKVPGNYPWTISREGYQIQTGTAVVVNQSIAIVVDLQKARGKLSVTVYDKELGTFIDNAAVTINGQTKYTNVNGVAELWDLVIGTWAWTCSKNEYYPSSGNLLVEEGENNTYKIYLSKVPPEPEPQYEVTFLAKEGYSFLSGVKISVDGSSQLITNSDGEAKITLERGTYNYRATYGTYYYDLASSFSVYGKMTVPLDFIRMKTDVIIHVYNLANGYPIQGASVSFAGNSGVTDANGDAKFYSVEMSSSYVSCTASKEPIYKARSDSFRVDSESPTFEIGLGANYYDVYFTIKDQSNRPLDNVKVQLNNAEKYTNYEGQAIFRSFLPGYSFTWQAFKAGYQSQNGSGSIVSDDVYINLTMIQNKCLVTYTVTDSSGRPISGVTVSDNVDSGVTSSSGQVSWYVPCSASYSWNASAPAYFPERGNFSVGDNETSKNISIRMEGDGALLEVDVSSNLMITLPIANTASTGLNNLRVNWGDGTQTIGQTTHTYTSRQIYQILFDFNGNSTTLQWKGSDNQQVDANFQTGLLRVLKWFASKVRTSWPSYAFNNYRNLSSIPGWATSLMSGTGNFFFQDCVSLRSVPRGCLSFATSYIGTYQQAGLSGAINLNDVLGGTNISSYKWCFSGTRSITSVTGTLSPSGTCSTELMFFNSSLSSISFNINATHIVNCKQMFSNTKSLSTPCQISFNNVFDASYFASNSSISTLQSNTFVSSQTIVLGYFNNAFMSATSLSSVSSNAIAISVSDASEVSYNQTFSGCKSLLNIANLTLLGANSCRETFFSSGVSSIPPNYFVSDKCTTYWNCFASCTNLRTVGDNIISSLSKVTSIRGMFKNCTNLQGSMFKIFAYDRKSGNRVLGGVYVNCTDFREAFYGCSKITAYPCFNPSPALTWYMPMCFTPQLANLYGLVTFDTISGDRCFYGCTGAPEYTSFSKAYPVWFT